MNLFLKTARLSLVLFLVIISVKSLTAGPIPPRELQERLKKFQYNSLFELTKFQVREGDSKNHKIYDANLTHLSMKDGELGQIPFVFYKSLKGADEAKPLVIIYPAINGITKIEKKMAKYFAKRGVHSIIAKLSELIISDPNRSSDELDPYLIKTTNSSRLLVDFAHTLKEVDHSKISAFGASLGGIRASLAMAIEPRLNSGFILVGGAGLPKILGESNQKFVTQYRGYRMKVEGYETVEDYVYSLQNKIQLDPLFFAHLRSPNDLHMVIASKDTAVPTETQWSLWEEFGRPEYTLYSKSHGAAIRKIVLNRHIVLNFFKSRWYQ